jgi:hypothetical protein
VSILILGMTSGSQLGRTTCASYIPRGMCVTGSAYTRHLGRSRPTYADGRRCAVRRRAVGGFVGGLVGRCVRFDWIRRSWRLALHVRSMRSIDLSVLPVRSMRSVDSSVDDLRLYASVIKSRQACRFHLTGFAGPTGRSSRTISDKSFFAPSFRRSSPSAAAAVRVVGVSRPSATCRRRARKKSW